MDTTKLPVSVAWTIGRILEPALGRTQRPIQIGSSVFDNCIHRYSLAHRAFHNLQHLEFVLTHFRHSCPSAHPLHDLGLLAILYHDCHVLSDGSVPTVLTPEACSAKAFVDECAIPLALSEDDIKWVSDTILATRTHDPTNDDTMDLILDGDLGALGFPRQYYRQYCWQLYDEFVHGPLRVSERDFLLARLDFLKKFLGRPYIYTHSTNKEGVARHNMHFEATDIEATLAMMEKTGRPLSELGIWSGGRLA